MQTAKQLSRRLAYLHQKRKAGKQQHARTGRLTPAQRLAVLQKTSKRCHVCGGKLTADNFHADHVVPHVAGGKHSVDNYLPACATCNNYRWHYLPEEIQWVMKLGVFAKTQIEKETMLGVALAESFMKYEQRKK